MVVLFLFVGRLWDRDNLASVTQFAFSFWLRNDLILATLSNDFVYVDSSQLVVIIFYRDV